MGTLVGTGFVGRVRRPGSAAGFVRQVRPPGSSAGFVHRVRYLSGYLACTSVGIYRAPIGHLSGPQWAPCGHLAGAYFLLVFFHYCFGGVASGGNSGIILVTRCTWKAAFGNAIYLDRFFVSYLLPTTNYYYITTDYLWGKQEKMVYRCLIDGWIYRLADA